MPRPYVEYDQFHRAVAELRNRFPGLRIEVVLEPNLHVDAEASLPAQPGLDFAFSFNLQIDELHLNVGALWVSWFPCRHDDVTGGFIDAVAGLISGRYRVLERLTGGGAVSAHLQRPTEVGGWSTITTSTTLRGLVPWPRDERVIQNRGAGPEWQRGAESCEPG